jgi:hypothetical protein
MIARNIWRKLATFMAIGFPRHRCLDLSRIGITILALTASFGMGAYASESSIAADQPQISDRESNLSTSLCTKDETVVFSCRTLGKKGKLLSLCGSKVLDEKTGYVQYRFGPPGKIELEFPKDKQNTQAAFRYSRYTRPLVTYLELRFSLGGYRYSIHEDYNEEESPPVKDASVEVSRPASDDSTARSVTLRCRQPVTGSLMNLEGVIPEND